VNKKIELLAPAGNLEKLKIALEYGADAVYGGVSHFSLRIRSSKEFSYESFEEAINYTHKMGKKIYVTINGFPFNSQIPLLKKHIQKMANMNPDAFIVSTPGVVRLSKELAPNIPLHLSTQANVMNYLDALFYADAGVKRIIVAREVSLKDLKDIKKHVLDMEFEIFVHGSMCFAYSGRCLISSLQSGRVPNRGSCANDCRFPYVLYAKNEDNGTLFKIEEDDSGTHIMNAKDLNLSGYVDKILESGVVDSLKIEGRTKSSYYLAITTRAYRMAIDDFYIGQFDADRYKEELFSTKHRGFNDGYLLKRPFEKGNTQNLEESISEGTHQVYAFIDEDGESFLARDKVIPFEEYEIIFPLDRKIEEVENEIGKISKKNGKFYLTMFKMKSKNGKIFEEIHSGNTNPILLPVKLPKYSFLRKKIKKGLK